MSKRIVIIILLVFLLVGCVSPMPTVTPSIAATAISAPSNIAIRPAVTAIPTETRLPRREPTVEPTPILPTYTPITPRTPQPVVISTATPASNSYPTTLGTTVPKPKDVISPDNVNQITELARWGKGRIESFVYSADSRFLALATSIGIYIYDVQTLEEIRYVETDQIVKALSFSPDGQTLASVLRDGKIVLWQLPNVTRFMVVESSMGNSYAPLIRFSADSKRIFTQADSLSKAEIWDARTGKLLNTVPSNTNVVDALSSNGDILVRAYRNGSATLENLQDGSFAKEIRVELPNQDAYIADVAVSPLSRTFAISVNYFMDSKRLGVIYIYDVRNGELVHRFDFPILSNMSYGSLKLGKCIIGGPDGGPGPLGGLKFLDESTLALSYNYGGGTQLWSIDGKLLKTLTAVGEISPNSEWIAYKSTGGSVSIQKVFADNVKRSLVGFSYGWRDIAISADGSLLAGRSYDQWLRVSRMSDGERIYNLEEFPSFAWAPGFSFSPDSQILAMAQYGGNIKLFRAKDGSEIRTLKGHQGVVYDVVFSPNNQYLFSVADDCSVRSWEVNTGNLLHVEQTSTYDRYARLTISPDGKILVLVSSWEEGRDGTKETSAWRIQDWTRFQKPISSTFATFLSATELFAIDKKGFSYIIDLSSAQTEKRISLDGASRDYDNLHLAFSLDRKLYIVPNRDSIGIGDLITGRIIKELRGHTDTVRDVRLSPDGRFIISASYDGTIRLWGVRP